MRPPPTRPTTPVATSLVTSLAYTARVQASSTVLAFGLSEGGGRLKSVSWRLGYRLGASGVTMRPSRVEPQVRQGAG